MNQVYQAKLFAVVTQKDEFLGKKSTKTTKLFAVAHPK